jgi:hypothetical protein
MHRVSTGQGISMEDQQGRFYCPNSMTNPDLFCQLSLIFSSTIGKRIQIVFAIGYFAGYHSENSLNKFVPDIVYHYSFRLSRRDFSLRISRQFPVVPHRADGTLRKQNFQFPVCQMADMIAFVYRFVRERCTGYSLLLIWFPKDTSKVSKDTLKVSFLHAKKNPGVFSRDFFLFSCIC